MSAQVTGAKPLTAQEVIEKLHFEQRQELDKEPALTTSGIVGLAVGLGTLLLRTLHLLSHGNAFPFDYDWSVHLDGKTDYCRFRVK